MKPGDMVFDVFTNEGGEKEAIIGIVISCGDAKVTVRWVDGDVTNEFDASYAEQYFKVIV